MRKKYFDGSGSSAVRASDKRSICSGKCNEYMKVKADMGPGDQSPNCFVF